MFNLFKKKSGKPVSPDLSFIGVDMHNHLLPGIDDGLKELEESVAFIKELAQLGYKKLICTPHILTDLYPNGPQTILPKLQLVKDALKKEGVDIQLEAAAEYMVDHSFAELIAKTNKDELLTIGGKYILIEMSYLSASPNIDQIVFDLSMMNLTPILAHPERYNYYHRHFEQYEHFKERGCKLQVNLLSLTGGYGPSVQKTAEKLLKFGMVDFLGTDMHHEKHLLMLKSLSTRPEFYEIVKDSVLLNKKLL